MGTNRRIFWTAEIRRDRVGCCWSGGQVVHFAISTSEARKPSGRKVAARKISPILESARSFGLFWHRSLSRASTRSAHVPRPVRLIDHDNSAALSVPPPNSQGDSKARRTG